MKVVINEVSERLDMLMDEWRYYIDVRTGEIFEIDQQYLGIAEDSDETDSLDDYLDWEKETIRDAIKFLEEYNYYIELPSKYDINEYKLMENFIEILRNPVQSNRLKMAISGKGAFRRFKDALNYLGIAQKWYDFKGKALEEIAIEWCKDNGLEYVIK